MNKIHVLCCILIVSIFSYANDEALPDPEAYFYAIIVNEINSSIHWYSDNLGFKLLNKINSEERGFQQANLTRGNVLIELIELRSSLTQESILENKPKKTKIEGFFKFGFRVSEFDNWIVALKKSKVEINGGVVTDNISGKRMLIINDPDGNRIQIFEK